MRQTYISPANPVLAGLWGRSWSLVIVRVALVGWLFSGDASLMPLFSSVLLGLLCWGSRSWPAKVWTDVNVTPTVTPQNKLWSIVFGYFSATFVKKQKQSKIQLQARLLWYCLGPSMDLNQNSTNAEWKKIKVMPQREYSSSDAAKDNLFWLKGGLEEVTQPQLISVLWI